MPREIVFGPEARLEFEKTVAWYHEQQRDLGDRFEAEVWATFQHILEHPERFRLVGRTVRVARLKVFHKYAVYFSVEADFIGVVAVFHSSRDPAELRRRLQ
jgi:plasmid stabilization system protein ParE